MNLKFSTMRLAGMVLTSTLATSFAYGDSSSLGQQVWKSVTSKITKVKPALGGFGFSKCQGEAFRVQNFNLEISAGLSNAVNIPFQFDNGLTHLVTVGSERLDFVLKVSSEDSLAVKPSSEVNLESIDLDQMDFGCDGSSSADVRGESPEGLEFDAELSFKNGKGNYTNMMYRNPQIGVFRLQVSTLQGRALQQGDDIYAAVKGTATVYEIDAVNGELEPQSKDVLFRFHYNGAGDEPVFNWVSSSIEPSESE